jgi:hypothetical protein
MPALPGGVVGESGFTLGGFLLNACSMSVNTPPVFEQEKRLNQQEEGMYASRSDRFAGNSESSMGR